LTPQEQMFDFAGMRLAPLNVEGAVAWITQRADAGRPSVVVTPNIHHLHQWATVPSARRVLDAADLQLADGWPLVVASHVLGQPLPERIAGIDLVGQLVDGDFEFSLAILGGPEETAHLLAERARGTNRVVLIDTLSAGWERPERRQELLARLEEAQPNLVLIGIGAPRQEQLADELRDAVRGPILCCGAAIEVLAGYTPRAPRLLQRYRLEWAFRLAIEPRRLLGRYLVSGVTFLRLLAAETFSRRVLSRASS
jgi:N-acetylglucosaminyldiphosphoundecaprenol N-acetyl-beta-D-mannosaminyltransferase